jgi:hypothetical protein
MEYGKRMASMVGKETRKTEKILATRLLNGTGTAVRHSGTSVLGNPWRDPGSVSSSEGGIPGYLLSLPDNYEYQLCEEDLQRVLG